MIQHGRPFHSKSPSLIRSAEVEGGGIVAGEDGTDDSGLGGELTERDVEREPFDPLLSLLSNLMADEISSVISGD